MEALRYSVPVVGMTAVCCWLAIRWAVDQFNNESVLFRESERFGVGLWFRHLVRDREDMPTVGEAVLCGVLILVIRFFFSLVAPPPTTWNVHGHDDADADAAGRRAGLLDGDHAHAAARKDAAVVPPFVLGHGSSGGTPRRLRCIRCSCGSTKECASSIRVSPRHSPNSARSTDVRRRAAWQARR